MVIYFLKAIRQLAHELGLNADSSNRLVTQFHSTYERARRYRGRDHVCDRDAWGMVVAKEPSKRELRKMFGVVAGFLLTETECVRAQGDHG